MRTSLDRRTTTERRVAPATCDKPTNDGTACRASAAWKCVVCNRMLCGMHVARDAGTVRCCFCYVIIAQLTPRVAQRRKHNSPDDDASDELDGGPNTKQQRPANLLPAAAPPVHRAAR